MLKSLKVSVINLCVGLSHKPEHGRIRLVTYVKAKSKLSLDRDHPKS